MIGKTEEFPWVGEHTYAPDNCRSLYQRGWVQGGVTHTTRQPGWSDTEIIPKYVSVGR